MPVLNPTIWIPASGQGYVNVPGENFLVTNSGNFLVTNSGNNLVTNGITVSGKYPTEWSLSGV